ncbi:hypothetical protein B0J14DRAFT_546063 [Halenospora varia]|nr:hypothetical protein B0J14DRAFT_546063 [Halenospora varia]
MSPLPNLPFLPNRPLLPDVPLEVVSSICEYVDHSGLRNIRFLSRDFNGEARRILFRTLFVKVNHASFVKLSKIATHETLRCYVKAIVYDGREFESDLADYTLEKWLENDAATGIGIQPSKRAEFLARFPQEQLQMYYVEFRAYLSSQVYVLEADNETKWLRNACRSFPQLSTVEYAENERGAEGLELQPMTSFSPLARQILAEPEDGWGEFDRHFWALVRAVFSGQGCLRQITQLRGEMLDYDNFGTFYTVAPLLDLSCLRLLSLEFISECRGGSTPALASFLRRAPNLESLRLSYGDYGSHNLLPSRLFDNLLYWKQLRYLSLQNMNLPPWRLRKLLQRHSATLRSLELSSMTLQDSNKTLKGSTRALWIAMIQFLSQSMSLKLVKFDGYFVTDSGEAWSTFGKEKDIFVSPPRYDNCLISRIEHFITNSGPCPFTLKSSDQQRKVDVEVGHTEHSWIPENFWAWEEDNTWTFAPFLVHMRGQGWNL